MDLFSPMLIIGGELIDSAIPIQSRVGHAVVTEVHAPSGLATLRARRARLPDFCGNNRISRFRKGMSSFAPESGAGVA
jgi:hypothetical protein